MQAKQARLQNSRTNSSHIRKHIDHVIDFLLSGGAAEDNFICSDLFDRWTPIDSLKFTPAIHKNHDKPHAAVHRTQSAKSVTPDADQRSVDRCGSTICHFIRTTLKILKRAISNIGAICPARTGITSHRYQSVD